jgi:hypothetical protein
MPIDDANRWDQRYINDPKFASDHPSTLLVEHVDLLPSSGLALDIAMGMGANSSYLIKHGLEVIGVDVSKVAVIKARNLYSSLQAVIADLEHFFIPPNTFDVIINFLYLQRNLWLPMAAGLKSNGTLFVECLSEDMLQIHPEINPQYLIKRGELRQVFLSEEMSKLVKVLYCDEGWLHTGNSHRRAVARLIAQRNS